jgi:hypothetical protein
MKKKMVYQRRRDVALQKIDVIATLAALQVQI